VPTPTIGNCNGSNTVSDTMQPQKLAIGNRWRETRRKHGGTSKERQFDQIKTVIGLSTEPPCYSMSVNIAFPRKDGTMVDLANTNTYTVQYVSANSCVLICSVALQTSSRCIGWMFVRSIEKAARKYVLEELQDYAKEAMKRASSGSGSAKTAAAAAAASSPPLPNE
jgi:hypothetical protein